MDGGGGSAELRIGGSGGRGYEHRRDKHTCDSLRDIHRHNVVVVKSRGGPCVWVVPGWQSRRMPHGNPENPKKQDRIDTDRGWTNRPGTYSAIVRVCVCLLFRKRS